jgi:fibronectin-binding autotransporter adhesin
VPGPINVTGGTLVVGNTVSPFILVPQFAGAPVTLADGASLQLNAVRDLARAVNAGNATLDFVGSNSQPSSTVSGTVTLAAGKTLAVSGSSAGQVRLAGLVTGPGALNLAGGNFVLAGANDYAGGTTVNTTALVSIGNDAAFGNPAGLVTLAGSGLFLAAQGGSRTLPNRIAVNADFQTVGVGRLTFAGDAALGGTGAARTVTVNSSGGLSLRNLDGPAGLQLAKAGGGTLILDGNISFAGTTAVAAGTLLIPTLASKTGTGAVAVGGNAAGAALATLGGGGSLAGPVTVNASGILAPGDSPGTLTLTGGLTMAGGSTYLWELAANTTGGPGINWDRVSLTGGDLALDPAARFVPSFTGTATTPSLADPFWQAGHTWQNVIDLSGTATNLGGNASLTIDNAAWASAGLFATQLNGLSVMLVWTPVPEPLHALAFGAMALAAGRFIKRRRAS